jgi:acyl dehydratase
VSAPAWDVGADLEERTLPPVNRDQLRRYAEASGDPNPIHLSDEAAEAAGLPGVIAHGMLTVATMGLLFSPYLEHGHVKTFRSGRWQPKRPRRVASTPSRCTRGGGRIRSLRAR